MLSQDFMKLPFQDLTDLMSHLQVNSAQPLTWSDGDVWVSEPVPIQPGDQLEYKCVLYLRRRIDQSGRNTASDFGSCAGMW